MLKITSLQNEKIKRFASLKIKSNREKERLFILDDIDLIDRAYQDNLLTTVLFVDSVKDYKNVELIEVNESIIKKISSVSTPTNIIGICKMKIDSEKGKRVVALDNVQDPGNGGTIVRSALAFNFDEVLLSDKTFDKYNEKFVRATKGSFFDLSIKKVNLTEELIKRKQEGYKIVAADLNDEAISIEQFEPSEKMILVLGNEGNGISPQISELVDCSVIIPISNKIESLNVGVAGSIIMYHINK